MERPRTARAWLLAASGLLALAAPALGVGRLVALDSSGRLTTVNWASGFSTSLAQVDAAVAWPESITFDCAGNRLFVSSRTNRTLHLLNPDTGASSLVAPYSGVVPPTPITWDSAAATLWGANFQVLLDVHPSTAATTYVGSTGLSTSAELFLAYDKRNIVLYAADDFSNALYTLNRTSAAATLVRTLGFISPRALAYNADNGGLYAIDGDSSCLFVLDRPSGEWFRVGPMPVPAAPAIQYTGLAYVDDDCRESIALGGSTYVTPYAAKGGTSRVITVNVLPAVGFPGNSTSITVSGNFSALGGSATQLFTNQSNRFRYTLNVPAGQTPRSYNIPITITDAQGRSGATVAVVRVRPSALQGFVTETEPNNSRESPNAVTLSSGQGVQGKTQGTSVNSSSEPNTVDYYQITTAPAPIGIYRHRLIPQSEFQAQGLTIRGRQQSSGVIQSTERVFSGWQTTSPHTPPIVWYGFGKGDSVYVRVSGHSGLIYDYDLTLESLPITAMQAVGTFPPGPITVTHPSTGAPFTDFLVYTAAGEPVSDFIHDSYNFTSSATRTLPAGDYILAFSDANTADNRAAPADSPNRSGDVLDFPYTIANSSAELTSGLSVQISGGTPTRTETFTFNKTQPYEVQFVRFTVAEPPASVVCCRGTTCTLVPAASSCTPTTSPVVGASVSPAPACGVTNNPVTGCCHANFNKDAAVTIDDIFIYLNAWFASSPYADVGGDGTTTPTIDDIFIFLNLWFQGC